MFFLGFIASTNRNAGAPYFFEEYSNHSDCSS